MCRCRCYRQSDMVRRFFWELLTFLGFVGSTFAGGKACLLEWPPFEVLLVAPTFDVSFAALLTSWLRLVTFEPFCFAGYAAYSLGLISECTIKRWK